ncbi:MFS transporter [Sphingobium sufflavum]|uniref:MFS transporter n=1 Tax=Sphingobium sufflavum TaxID=1129547 RepID=UPI001F35D016|nr:MFS transporter [Sphingobium sufflavum]MCE7798295.1 MFS transporter [Sphingobium sufflavum]
MKTRTPGPGNEWQAHWPLLLSATMGVSVAAIPLATLGVFMAPLQDAFGWSRTEISAGLTLFAFITLPFMPLAGMLVDRYGARRVALPGLLLSSLAFAAFSVQTGSLTLWFATWVAYTLASLSASILVWSSAISSAFRHNRGLALALLLCGNAVTQALAPLASLWLIDAFGWRVGYIALAGGWGGSALLLAALFFRERGKTDAATPTMEQAASAQPSGLSVPQALRSLPLYRIALATFLQTTLSAATVVHLIPMLTSLGQTRADAASFVAIFALAAIAGKLLTGWLVDRVDAAWLPSLCYAGPGISFFLLLNGAGSPALLLIAIAVLGYCSGASLQLTTYLTTRFAGLRNFATIFGFISTVMALAGGVGPVLGGLIFDYSGGYVPLLTIGMVTACAAGLCVLGLGRYPEFRQEPAAHAA